MNVTTNTEDRELARVLDRILDEIRAGLQHGYFSFELECEMAPRGVRMLTLRAGRSWRFHVQPEALER